jgi:hypothetical protein
MSILLSGAAPADAVMYREYALAQTDYIPFRAVTPLFFIRQNPQNLVCASATVEQLRKEELARLYHIPIPKQTDLPISYNIAPSQKVLTIRFNPETRARLKILKLIATAW